MPELDALQPLTRIALPMRRVAVLVIVLFVAGVAAASSGLHQRVVHLIELSEPVIAGHPVAGAFLFVGLAAVSAILVFFSSVVLVPFGVHAYGEATCFLLLWTGWFLGGALTYTIGRRVGWPLARWLLPEGVASEYESRFPASRPFLTVLLLQSALPSEAAGYLCGLLRVPPLAYLGALAVAEVPYALGTVLLGAAFFQRQYPLLLSVAASGLLLVLWTRWRRSSRRTRAA
jgi:uncharacterized membrane protein YdjX (TVP38/TMEM64 family)